VKLVAYLRVSTDTQAEHGLGLDVQRKAISAWARSCGHKIALWTSDHGVSGSNGLDKREGLLDALTTLREHRAFGLAVYRLDRLARDLVLQETLLREIAALGCRVHSTAASEDAYLDPDGEADDPSRALIRQILGAVAAYERSMIRLRMRSGKSAKRDRGGFIGGQVPYGYRTEVGELVPDPAEQHGLDVMRSLRARGMSLRAICAELERQRINTKAGGPWESSAVGKILHRGAPGERPTLSGSESSRTSS
jgi:DNA invertase Pin-like site-specific DNA recombinase